MKPRKKVKRWMKLDNAAKIYPVARSRRWTALFRLSAELDEPIDPDILAQAQRSTLRRFPGFAQRLRHGLFWYYLEHIDGEPEIQQDVGNPCVRMVLKENGGFMFRVRYHACRIAVEIFHVLADGTGGICFLQTLVAEYLRLRYGLEIPRSDSILDCSQKPQPDELEDSYLKYAREQTRSRGEPSAYHIRGTDEPIEIIHITTGILPTDAVLAQAKQYGATLTEYLTAVLLLSVDAIQRQTQRKSKRFRPVKICIPVNLRKYYPTNTMRNFASYVNPGIDPKLGRYTLEETIRAVHSFMGLEASEKMLNAKFTANVKVEQNRALRIAPLFLKKWAMRCAFYLQGDRQTSTLLSNLGQVRLPAPMARHVRRFDFIIGPLSYNRVCSACVSYDGTLMINFTRTIAEPVLERTFFTYLVKQGIPVRIESNQQW